MEASPQALQGNVLDFAVPTIFLRVTAFQSKRSFFLRTPCTFSGVCHVTNHINTTRSKPYSFRNVQKVTRHLQTLLLKDIAEMALSEQKCGVSGKRCSLASETLSTLLLPSPRASYPCRRSAEDAEQLFKNSNFLRDKLDQTAMCNVAVQKC